MFQILCFRFTPNMFQICPDNPTGGRGDCPLLLR